MSKKEIIALTIAGNDSDGSAGMPAIYTLFMPEKFMEWA